MENILEGLGILIPIIGVSLPAIIILIVFAYESRNKKKKYDTIIEVSKNISDPEEIRNLIKGLEDNQKKSPIDLRRSGVNHFRWSWFIYAWLDSDRWNFRRRRSISCLNWNRPDGCRIYLSKSIGRN